MTVTVKEYQSNGLTVSLKADKDGLYFVEVSKEIKPGFAQTVCKRTYYNEQAAKRSFNRNKKTL